MKAFALFSLALASCVALAQDVSTKITYSTKAVPLERALKELSEISGVKLDMASAMAAEVVVIKAENVPLKELTDRIAAVTAGEWRKEGEVFKLHPDQAARSREASTENVAKVAALKKAIEERVKALSPKPATTKGQKEEEEELRLGPDEDEKAITLLLSSIDPAVLANLQSGDRLVFSTNPNRMQRSMGQAAPGIINTFVQEHNKSVVDSKMPDNDDLPPGVEIPDFIRDMINRRTKPIGRVGKALLVASKMPMFGTVQLELRLYDPQGNVVHSAPSMLSANEMMEMVRTMAGDAKPQATGKETPVELSEHSKAITQALGGMMSMGGIKTSMKLRPR